MKIKYTLLFTLALTAFATHKTPSILAANIETIQKPNVIVSAAIGIPKMALWGYGPPKSVLRLVGIGTEQTITSDQSGYFIFDPVYLPTNGDSPELCVIAIDSAKRTTPPICVPPVPQGNFFYNIGPVILPPTISIGAPETHNGSQVSAQGQAIPNTDIEVKLARPDAITTGIRLVKTAYAYYIPSYSITSDAYGNYSFNMPTNKDNAWRVFAIADSEFGKSPKSNTLKFETLSSSTYAWRNTIGIFTGFLTWPKILVLIVPCIFLIVVYLVLGRIHNKKHQNTSDI